MVKLSDPISTPDGDVTTCAALLDSGRGVLGKSDKWRKRGGRTGTAYFVEWAADRSFFWEIGKTAYLSRSKQPIEIG